VPRSDAASRRRARRARLACSLFAVAGCVPDPKPAVDSTAAVGFPGKNPSRASDAPELLRADFDAAPLGVLAPAQLASLFGAVEPWSVGFAEGRVTVVPSGRGRSLRVAYPAGSVGPHAGGAEVVARIPGDHDELYCSYRVRFPPGFDFVRGGKLPGLAGGSHPSGGHPRTDGFSARMMWRPGGAAVQYVYSPRQTTTYGVDLPYRGARFHPGVWHIVTHRIVMNTPGRADGIIQGWFDGQLALDERDAELRLDASGHVDVFFFSTFFGGNDPSWGAARDEAVDFDDLVISTAPPVP
jgi:hypothetical protein